MKPFDMMRKTNDNPFRWSHLDDEFVITHVDPSNPHDGDLAFDLLFGTRAWRNNEEWWEMECVEIPASEFWDEDYEEWSFRSQWVPTDRKANPTPDESWILFGSMIEL